MQQQSSTQKRALIASLIGSSIEWFDFFLYGTAAALVFNKLFFVNDNLSYRTYAFLSFFWYPVFHSPSWRYYFQSYR